MLLFYNFFIFLYGLLLSIAARFKIKAHRIVEGRKNTFPYLETVLKENKSPIVWFHCASLGEFEQGRPVIEAFRKAFPDYKILLTFFSSSGYEVRKNYDKADYICYLPADTPTYAKKFVELVQPEMAYFVKYEFWYHFIKELKLNHIPAISISAIFRKEQHFFKWYGSFARKTLRNFTYIFVQDLQSKALLNTIGLEEIQVSGDTRFDQVHDICSHPQHFPLIKAFKDDKKLLIVGSSWPEDIEALIPLINNHDKNLRFIIAPHEINENGLQKLEQKINKGSIRYSRAAKETISNYQVLIIDNIGMLSSLYQYGEFAYIGGGFGTGVHNILEAATFGLPVFFGNKNYKKFREANELIALKAAFSVADSHEFLSKFYQLFQDKEQWQQASQIAAEYIQKNRGATKKIMNYSIAFLNKAKTA
ncbi:3-deoxy-D-manno-octulosonic acid transferase [Xanthovirga aplysinae]|uniref:3-deoxy-D-manno-octulosonic acid transferase n=1 Tax=Xanthovirga aplysinae TaxID=2529853 RepID=UPI0012BC4940|nr:glycosyltransferase N-terminal domain-containing protein [Xanthovirga aplysinae]MTI30096.1 3-deoxy-D-manno-octulosonic acid transferase [Xanthovirga aplysinae]